jgi:hypothetical protein
MDNLLNLVANANLTDLARILVSIVHMLFMVVVLLVLVVFNKRIKVLENLPSIKDFLRSHHAKKKCKSCK